MPDDATAQPLVERPSDSDLERMDESELRAVLEDYTVRVSRLTETLSGQVALAWDNLGWQPMGSAYSGSRHGPTLACVQDIACVGEQVATINPLAKRGIAVRASYIWGGRTQLRRIPKRGRDVRSIHRVLSSTTGQFEIERALAATGNLFFEVNGRRALRVVPMCDITDAIADSSDPSVVTYYQVSYDDAGLSVPGGYGDVRIARDARTGNRYSSGTVRREWIPSVEQTGTVRTSINGVAVSRTKRMKHIAVNRVRGWWWGIPDLYAVIMWLKSYKEYLEDNKVLTKAFAQFAWKVTVNTPAGGQRAASRLAQAPTVDPATGAASVGAAAVLGANQDMSPLQTIRPVDFNNGRPLAAMVAAGLEIPLQVLLSDAGAGGSRRADESLGEATERAMQARQQMMDDELTDVANLLGLSSFGISWPQVAPEPTHRVVQALDMAGRSGMLYPKEWREGLARALDQDWKGPPPEVEELPYVVRPAAAEAEAGIEAGAEVLSDEEAPGQQDILDPPAQIEPPSYGDHELRDEGYQDHVRDT